MCAAHRQPHETFRADSPGQPDKIQRYMQCGQRDHLTGLGGGWRGSWLRGKPDRRRYILHIGHASSQLVTESEYAVNMIVACTNLVIVFSWFQLAGFLSHAQYWMTACIITVKVCSCMHTSAWHSRALFNVSTQPAVLWLQTIFLASLTVYTPLLYSSVRVYFTAMEVA